jgi:DNA-binding beta-propeller fold protein YncE
MRASPFAAALCLAVGASSMAAETLTVQATIALPHGEGRIDHLAYSRRDGRLFVAELGNDSVAVVDVPRRKLVRRLEGIKEPQGIAYYDEAARLYVASGGDGTVRAYDSRNLTLVGSIKLAGDADNIRIDREARRVYVGYGDGALAVLDSASLERIGDIRLKGHPESFQLSPTDAHIYVNIPDSREIAVVDRTSARQVASWPASPWSANYPMAIDRDGAAIIAVFRDPARVAKYSMSKGTLANSAPACGDADDVFIDQRRGRIYAICGAGFVEVLDLTTLKSIAKLATSPGARTGLFAADEDLLFVAARAHGNADAAIWVLKPGD